jgi:lysozyme
MAKAARTVVTIASAGAMALALGTVQKWEGFAPTVVPDKLANGLPTGGYGETVGVKLGETHDKKFWADRLAKRLAEDYDAGIGKCITRQDAPDSVRGIAISASYNAGVGAVCSSAMVRKMNAGDFRGACEALRHWRICSHPQGPSGPCVVQRGLQNRRNDEANKCLAGIDEKPVVVIAAAPAPAPEPAPTPTPAAPPIAKADAPEVPWWRALFARLRCWIFICEVPK